jgi:hypothetical protein
MAAGTGRAQAVGMFQATCHRAGRRVLLGNERIVSVVNDDAGILLRFRCWCGELEELRTGRPRRGPVEDLV